MSTPTVMMRTVAIASLTVMWRVQMLLLSAMRIWMTEAMTRLHALGAWTCLRRMVSPILLCRALLVVVFLAVPLFGGGGALLVALALPGFILTIAPQMIAQLADPTVSVMAAHKTRIALMKKNWTSFAMHHLRDLLMTRLISGLGSHLGLTHLTLTMVVTSWKGRVMTVAATVICTLSRVLIRCS
jgi:hypothetical protein